MLNGFNTRAVQAGDLKIREIGNVVTPIFENSTFIYPNSESEYMDSSSGMPYIYSRWGNPTVQSLEDKYRALENTGHAVAFSSGMGAITAAVLSNIKKKRILSIMDLYGQTFQFFSRTLKTLGIHVDFIDVDKLNNLDFDAKNYDLVYAESITNPLLKVIDIKNVAAFCHENDVLFIDDATFASPYNQNPVELGADIVVHSATKYISGHSDVIIGIAGTNNYYNNLIEMRKTLGASPDAFQAYLSYRGLKTLGLRMERHNKNAMELARFLRDSKKVLNVNYPGLDDNKYHKIAGKEMRGYGGMLSFTLNSMEDAHKLIKNLEIPAYAASLGGVESLITMPVETTHASLSPEERRSLGISDSLVRFSTGIEDIDDIIKDFENALSKL
ncbi:PLP-dependent transferase [Picrophilus oshimae]|uniref:cysteine-S-conjugate beta-lyase n=1 Tax=Picrophilus torridus (strain ATCC 700027 / DSM 9790 / JCM 10055 / NBRC 100828 / KAW 2/3) TaxID=1122961 RepID=A0A8G2FXH1_PICTO|nr:PLP-dependent transferase [Picrophilus oshimae]SMD31311.1 cystathionine gamma-synthase [Picrophilus oshimae DSM 9789]